MSLRTRAREIVVQLLYQEDMRKSEVPPDSAEVEAKVQRCQFFRSLKGGVSITKSQEKAAKLAKLKLFKSTKTLVFLNF